MTWQEYTIRQYDHGGIAVFGSIPVNEFSRLCKRWDKEGMVFCAQAADALGAAFAVATPDVAKEWAAQVKADANGDWLRSGDTGTSSRTIYSVLSGDGSAVGRYGADVPHDEDDFGRCHRLLEQYPDWRGRLGEVAAKYPAWGPFAREWAALTELYLMGGLTARAQLDRQIESLKAEVPS